MTPWMIFFIGSALLILITIGGFLLYHRKSQQDSNAQKAVQDARLLVLSLFAASLSILAYIAFAFGKR